MGLKYEDHSNRLGFVVLLSQHLHQFPEPLLYPIALCIVKGLPVNPLCTLAGATPLVSTRICMRP